MIRAARLEPLTVAIEPVDSGPQVDNPLMENRSTARNSLCMRLYIVPISNQSPRYLVISILSMVPLECHGFCRKAGNLSRLGKVDPHQEFRVLRDCSLGHFGISGWILLSIVARSV